MNIRKRLKHRADLSFYKRWGWYRKENGSLVMWNIFGNLPGGVRRMYRGPYITPKSVDEIVKLLTRRFNEARRREIL